MKIHILMSMWLILGTWLNGQGQNINRIEYFIDHDPGYGMGTTVSFTPGTSVTNTFEVPIASISNGLHFLSIRALDDNGKWSTVVVRRFLKEQVPVLASVDKIEYFLNEDPGFGNGTDVPFTPSISTQDFSFTAPLPADLPEGLHWLSVRARDTNGKWSTVLIRRILKEEPVDLTRIEYFVDSDPGFGNGTNIPFTTSSSGNPGRLSSPGTANTTTQAMTTSVESLSFDASLNNLPMGNHFIFVRVLDSKGRWSTVMHRTVEICETPVNTVVTPAGPLWLCSGVALTLRVETGNTYQWYKGDQPIGNATTHELIVSEVGTYSVQVTGAGGCTARSNEVQVLQSTKPAAPTISATETNLCGGGSTSLQATSCLGTVKWSDGQTGNTITVSPSQTTSYSATCSTDGCESDDSAPVIITVITAGSICQSTGSGAWNDASKWSCGRVPTSCDNVVVQQGHVINLNVEGQAINLSIEGNSRLEYGAAGKLKFGK